MQGMQVAAEPLSAPPYATECAMTLDGKSKKCKIINRRFSIPENVVHSVLGEGIDVFRLEVVVILLSFMN